MTAAVAGVGTQIGLGNASSPQTFNAIAEILSISGPELSSDMIDVTTLDSSGGFKEFLPGLKDGGSVQLEMNWLTGNTYQQTIRDRVANGTAGEFLIVWPDSPATRVQFTAIVESWNVTTEPSSQITASATLKISGAPDWTTTATVT